MKLTCLSADEFHVWHVTDEWLPVVQLLWQVNDDDDDDGNW